MTPTDRANDIKAKLTDVENKTDALLSNGPNVVALKASLSALHKSLDDGLTEHGSTLGISGPDQTALHGGGTNKHYGNN